MQHSLSCIPPSFHPTDSHSRLLTTRMVKLHGVSIGLKPCLTKTQGSIRGVTASAGVVAQPVLEDPRSIEIKQGIGQGFKGPDGQGLNEGPLVGVERAAAALELAQGKSGGLGLAALLLPLQESYLPAR